MILDRTIARMLPAVPKPLVHKLAQRYIAGPTLADACRVVRAANAAGKLATIDVLGEEITRGDEARAIARAYRDVFETIERQELDSNVSVKLTALGLKLDYDLCQENLESVVGDAARRGNFVRIDMEDASTTDDTLRLYRQLREAGHENVGVVLQAYLRRTLDDIRSLADLQPSVRICKGIYLEPPELAFQGYEEVR
ncbi:MAG TPA: proline dehydrogenase family protein, partial [Gaiellaceae bacterium]|nr:proline dehydrogenase family protein [Gaiellaceae bacterium]